MEFPAQSGISPLRLRQLTSLIASGQETRFYDWPEWGDARTAVLRVDHNECQRCRDLHRRYRRAVLVHHVQHLKDRPDLALSLLDPATGQRQLVSLCRACHEDVHPERRWRCGVRHQPVTPERWD